MIHCCALSALTLRLIFAAAYGYATSYAIQYVPLIAFSRCYFRRCLRATMMLDFSFAFASLCFLSLRYAAAAAQFRFSLFAFYVLLSCCCYYTLR